METRLKPTRSIGCSVQEDNDVEDTIKEVDITSFVTARREVQER
jgi:hypothetical protein